jgi:signal transduction histidine kinase/CheY-like chemotaxis protein
MKFKDPNLIGKGFNNLGVIEFAAKQTDSCLVHLQNAVRYRELAGDAEGIVQAYANLGYITYRVGLVPEAIDYLYKGLDIAEKSDNLEGKEALLNYLGQLYNEQGDLIRSTEIARERVKIAKTLNDDRLLVSSYNSMAVVMNDAGKTDSAFYYYNKGLEIVERVNYDFGKAIIYQNMANIYFSEKECNKALELHRKAYAIWKKILFAERQVLINSDLTRTFLCLQMPDSALHYAKATLAIANETGTANDYQVAYQYLYQVYEVKGDYKLAFENLKLHQAYTDSIFNQENTRQLEQQKLSYNFNKREAQLLLEQEQQEALSAAALAHQKMMKNISIGVGIVVLLLAIGLLNRYLFKQKTARELQAKNAEVEGARARAERSEAFRKQFLANMSHEIRTPMNAILGMTRLLKGRRLDAQSLTYLNAVDHAANNLLVVINDVLDLSKLEAGKMEATLHPAYLSAELEMLSTTFTLRADEKDLRFEMAKNPDLPEYIITDMARVIQILYNLLGNAVKFTNSGKVRLEVNHREMPANKTEITFAVIDTGIGIPPEKQAEIFESFGQGHTHDSRQYGGTGLGLTIARSLVELLGGRLSLESTPGVGSTFSFSILCEASNSSSLENYISRNAFTLSERHRSYPIRILLADDNEYNRLVATDTLKKYLPQAEIDATESGAQVIEMLPQKAYDLVLMDVQMPGMDGYSCTRVIRSLSDEGIRNIHIVAFTASVIRTDIQKCFEAGMNGYIPKPFRDEDLLKPIAALIDKFPDRESGNKTIAHGELNQGHALFLKLVPKRLEKVKAALDEEDATTVKNTIHLMRPQLIDAGMAEHSELFEWFEYLDVKNPNADWKRNTESFCNLVTQQLVDIRAKA